jgi:hypothetical protein
VVVLVVLLVVVVSLFCVMGIDMFFLFSFKIFIPRISICFRHSTNTEMLLLFTNLHNAWKKHSKQVLRTVATFGV